MEKRSKAKPAEQSCDKPCPGKGIGRFRFQVALQAEDQRFYFGGARGLWYFTLFPRSSHSIIGPNLGVGRRQSVLRGWLAPGAVKHER